MSIETPREAEVRHSREMLVALDAARKLTAAGSRKRAVNEEVSDLYRRVLIGSPVRDDEWLLGTYHATEAVDHSGETDTVEAAQANRVTHAAANYAAGRVLPYLPIAYAAYGAEDWAESASELATALGAGGV